MRLVYTRYYLYAGVLAFALAVLAAVGVLPAGTRDTVAPVTNRTVVQAGVVVAALAVLLAVVTTGASPRSGNATRDRRDGAAETPLPGSVSGAGRPVGEEIETAVAAVDDATHPWKQVREQRAVRRPLREAAIEAVARSEGISRAAAAERVADGSWTDDPRAAALLADDAATLPVWVRLVDWVHGDPFERSARATVVAIADRAGVETEVTAP